MKKGATTASIIYVLFAVVFMGVHLIQMPTLLANFCIALVGFCALGWCFLRKGISENYSHLFLYGIAFSWLMSISILYNGNADLRDILWIWAYMGVAALLYDFSVPSKICWWVAYGTILYMFIYILSGGTPADFLTYGSENNVSVYAIFFVLIAYLSQMKGKEPLKYLPAFLALAISLWSGSRGGSLSCAVMIGSIFLYNFLVVKKGKFNSVLKIGALLLCGVYLLERFGGSFIQAFIDKMDRYGSESVRTEIWLEYINSAFSSVSNFLLGADTMNASYIRLFSVGGNTHNSFLMMHAKFGLIPLICLIVLYATVWSKSVKEKNGVIIITLLTASARMFFDWIAFPGLYDVFFWYMLLYVLDKKKSTCA